jgi:hypothetical protein
VKGDGYHKTFCEICDKPVFPDEGKSVVILGDRYWCNDDCFNANAQWEVGLALSKTRLEHVTRGEDRREPVKPCHETQAECEATTRWEIEQLTGVRPGKHAFDTYADIASGIAKVVETKQTAYGDSFGKSGAVMRILYPQGVGLDQLDDALTVVRVLDKLFRIATDKDALGESPWQDIAGYCLLALKRSKG